MEPRERLPMLKNRDKFLVKKGIKVTVLNEDPMMVYISGLLSQEECEQMISLGKPKLEPSTTVIANSEEVRDGRSSQSAFLSANGVMPDDQVLSSVVRRCAELTGYPATHFEGIKVVNYHQGEAYYGHYDYFGQDNPSFLRGCGDRMMTFFIYLNTLSLEDGGTTSFPKLGLKVVPRRGDAVFWMNYDFAGNPQPKTFHSGDPILNNVEKWGVNVWIRQKSYGV